MKTLYGDATPFPHGHDFLATLQRVIGASVTLLHAAEARDHQELRKSKLEADAARDRRAVQELSKKAEQTLRGGASQALSTRAIEMRARAVEALMQRVEREIATIDRELAAASTEVEAATQRRQLELQPTLAQLLLEHELPNTIWGCTWHAREGSELIPGARAVAIHPGGLEASFRLAVDEGSPWARVGRVRDFVGEIQVMMPTRRGTLRDRSGMKRRKLGALYVAAVDAGPKRTAVLLKTKLEEGATGYLVTRIDGGALDIKPVCNPRELGLSVAREQQPALASLLDHLARDVRQLVEQREEVTAIRFADEALSDISAPEDLAMMLLDTIGDLTREIVRRSPREDELCLKRDLGGRRREELFLPVAELRARIDELPPSARAPFNALGLGTVRALDEDTKRVVLDFAQTA